MTDDPKLAEFTPDLTPPPTNGSRTRRRRVRFPGGITLGVLLGMLVAVNLVSRIQWLNLGRVGSWTRPAIAAGVAGLMAGGFDRERLRVAAVSGAVSGVLSLWVVYAMVRLSTRVIFIERSIVATIAIEALLLTAVGGASGFAGAVLARSARAVLAGGGTTDRDG